MLSLRLVPAIAVATGLLAAAPSPAVADQGTITEIVLESGGDFDSNRRDYDILLNAVVTAGLAEALDDPDAELTVFAPNDRAFVKLAKDLGYEGGYDEEAAWVFLVDALTGLGGGDPIPVLTDILLYHVTAGDVRPVDLILATIFGARIETLLGETIRPFFVFLIDNDPDLRNPRVVRPLDVEASNGRIHTVTRVLVPIDLP
ncbi:MAG: fasciclin domain-containing protein [Planctomycetota bacterium]|nr:fasciclin domain-containing protein [Planctomycetota bacterium]